MPRYALKVEYDGGPFSGWQRQAGRSTVQGAIEAALGRIEPRAESLAGAGRTDAGVHATGQVAHVDLTRAWDAFRLAEALNHHLKPQPIAILAAAEVSADWHARFSAVGRRYRFLLVQRRAPLAIEAGRAWHVRHPLDRNAMRGAARHLLGRHDFTTFRSSECQAQSPVKTLDAAEIDGPAGGTPGLYTFRFAARSFLHSQIRSFVGTLERVGAGAWTPSDVASALAARNRAACGPVCPPHGLYLDGVDYAHDPFA